MKQLIQTLLKAASLFLIMTFVISTGCQQQTDYSKELKPLADKYLEVWQTGNVDELDAIFDPGFVRHSDESTSANGLEDMKRVIREFKTTYPDVKIVSTKEIFSENQFAGHWSMTVSDSAGKSISQWGINIIHFKNGKIAEEWDAFDNVPFLEQLGYKITPPSETTEKNQ